MKFANTPRLHAVPRKVLAVSIASIVLAGSALGTDPNPIWDGQAVSLTPADGGIDVTIESSTTVTLGGPGSAVSELSIFNRSHELPAVTTLTINSADATSRTLASGVTILASAFGQTLVIAGGANFRPGSLADNGFNVELVKTGTGELIFDGIFNDVDGVLLRVVSGTVSVEGGGGTASPISSLMQAIRIDGAAAKLRLGTLDGSSTTFNNSLLVNDSGTLEHSATSNDTLTGFVNIDNAKTLTANVTAGSLTLSGPVNGGGLTKTGGGILTLAGLNGFTGVTTVSAGTLIATNAAAFNPTAGGTVTVNGGALNYFASADAPLSLHGTLTITGGANTAIGGSIGASATSAQINVTGAATISNAAHKVNIYGIASTTPVNGIYTLVHGGAGSSLNPATLPALGTVYNNTNFTVGALSHTATDLQVAITSATALTGAFWKGGLAGSTNVWSASDGAASSNWTATSGGAAQALVPGSGADVTISGSAITSAPTATVLGVNMTIKSLTIADTVNGLGLNSDGNTLTVTPSSSATGITVHANVPASLIAAKVAMGANQTWTNNSANPLTVSGIVSGTSNLLTTGSGTIVLSGANIYTGATTVSGGTLAVTGSLGNTAIAVSAGATLAARPSSGIGYAGGSVASGTSGLTLQGGAVSAASYTMADNAIGTFRIGTGGLTTQAGLVFPTLTFEIGSTLGSIDLLDLATFGGNASIAPGTKVSFAALSSATSLALGNYTFLTTAASGLGPAVLTLASSTITVGSNNYNLALSNSTATQATLTISAGIVTNDSVLGVTPASLSFGRVLATAIGTKTITVSRMSGTSNTGATAAVTGGAAGATIGATASGNGFVTGSQSWVINAGLTASAGAHSDTVVITNTGNNGQGANSGGPGLGSAQLPMNVSVTGNVLGLRSVTATPLALDRQLATTHLNSLTRSVTFNSSGTHADATDVTVDGNVLFNDGTNTRIKSITGQNAVLAAGGTFYSAPVVTGETGLGDTYASVPVSYTATPLALRSVTATPVSLGRQLATTNLNGLTRTVTFNSSGSHTDTTDVTVDGSLVFNDGINMRNKGITGQNAVLAAGGTFYSAPVVTGEAGLGDTYGNVPVSYTATPLALRLVAGTVGDLGRVMNGTNLSSLTRTVTFNSSGSHADTTDVTVDGSLLFNDGINMQNKGITGQNAVLAASGIFYSAPVVTAESGLGDTYANVAVSYTATPVQDRVITADTVSFGLVHAGAVVAGAATLRTTGNSTDFTAVGVANASGGGFSLTGGTNPVFTNASVTDVRTLGGTLGTAGVFMNATALTLTPGTEAGVAGAQNPVAVVVSYDASVFSGSAVWNKAGSGSWGQSASADWTDTTTPAIHAAPGTFGAGFAATDAAIFNAGGSGTVTLDGVSPSLAAITFNGGTQTIAQGTGGVLTLKNNPGAATITDSGGSQSIAAPVVLSSNLIATVTQAGDMLTLSGGIAGAGKTLTKEGAGVLTLSGVQDYATLNANAGTTYVNGSFTGGTATVHANATTHFNASQTLAALFIGDGVEVTFGDGLGLVDAPEKFTAAVPEPGTVGLLLVGALGVLGRRRRQVRPYFTVTENIRA